MAGIVKCCRAKFGKDSALEYASTVSFRRSRTQSSNYQTVNENELDASTSKKSSEELFASEKSNLRKYQMDIQKNCAEDCPTRMTLSPMMADKFSDIRSSNNLHLATILFLKVVHPEAPCPFAIDAESYDVFKDFFEPVIAQLQNGNKSTDFCKGLAFGDADQFEDLNLNDDRDVLRVMYADVIVRRNLNDFNLAGILTSDQRMTIRDTIRSKCKEVFSSLSSITIPEEWVNRMKADEPYLSDSMAMRDYPSGRFNMAFRDDCDAIMGGVINFDDHLQLIISINNGRLGHIYNQMSQILNSSVFCKMEFMKHKTYGFVTYSPQFIGSGFNIRVFIKLPFISKLNDVEQLYLKDLGLTLRPSSCQRPDLMILTNKITLNITELQIFNNILEGFRRMDDLDTELESTTPHAVMDDTMPVENLGKLVSKIYGCDNARTYTKKFLNDNIVNHFSGISTTFNGLFNHCIRANAFYNRSLFPKACDPDCYATFGRFFNPILLDANNARQFLHSNSPLYGVAHSETRYKFKHNLIKGYRVRFSRNFEDYPFSMQMSMRQLEEIETRMTDAFRRFPKEIEGRYIKLEQARKDDCYNFLLALNLIPKATNSIKKASWVYRNWPKHRGIFLANRNPQHPDNVLTVIVNEDDHFQVSCINYSGQRLDYCYDRAVVAVRFMDTFFKNSYAKKPNYGFLSSNPQNVGCCMRISAKVFLVNLSKDVHAFNEFCLANKMNYRGANGSGTLSKDNIFDVSLKFNLNYSELQILMFFLQRLKDLILEEWKYDHNIVRPNNYQLCEDVPLPLVYKVSKDKVQKKKKTSKKTSKKVFVIPQAEISASADSTASKNNTMSAISTNLNSTN